MTISVGDHLPEADMLIIGTEGPERVSLSGKVKGRNVVIFGLPGAFTGTCSALHVPSFIRVKDALAAKGIDEIICVSVNDPHVMRAWGEATGAAAAGITMLADADGSYTKALGLDFNAPDAGFFGRSSRYSMFVQDGVVKVLNRETARGVCDISSGETMVKAI